MVNIIRCETTVIVRPPIQFLERLAYIWQTMSQDRTNPVAASKLCGIETFCCLIWGKQAWKDQTAAAQTRPSPNLYGVEPTPQNYGTRAFAMEHAIVLELAEFDEELAEILQGRDDPVGILDRSE